MATDPKIQQAIERARQRIAQQSVQQAPVPVQTQPIQTKVQEVVPEAEEFVESPEDDLEETPVQASPTEVKEMTEGNEIAEQVAYLQNNGIYRRELIAVLQEISKSLELIALNSQK